MHTIQTQAQISGDRVIMISLPDDIPEGDYNIVVKITPQVPAIGVHPIHQLAGKVKAFKKIKAVDWQREIRDEWN